MRVTDQDIARAARQMRDEQNAQLHVAPWKGGGSSRGGRRPLWYALPAAAVAGFVLGYLTPKTDAPGENPLTAIVDTVYIKVNELKEDTLPRPEELLSPRTEKRIKKAREAVSPSRRHQSPATGIPVAEDKIRYDLLVQN